MNRWAIWLSFALLAPSMEAAERLDDSLSPRQRLQVNLDWKYPQLPETDLDSLNAIVGIVSDVQIVLDTSEFQQRRARIFLVMPLEFRGDTPLARARMSWTTRGRFQSGSASPGGRALVFEGRVDAPVLGDFFDFTFDLDARDLTTFLRLEPFYEIELLD